MAKRKQARSGSRMRKASRPARAAAGGKRTRARRPARKTTSRRPRSTAGRGAAARQKSAAPRQKSTGGRKKAARPSPSAAKRAASQKRTAGRTRGATGRAPVSTTARKSTSTTARKSSPAGSEAATRRLPARRPRLDRERRILAEAVPGPPSSLDLDRHASAARTGRAEIREALTEHTESSPRLTGGDVDADWENAYSTGDEAPGGDMPTPDQDIVEEIGASLGVQYNDDEELKAADKIADRDRHRWELDPASSDDYRDRNKRGS